MINIKNILLLAIFSFLFTQELSKEQLDKIKAVSEDINKAPNFTLKTVSESTIVLEKLQGKVVLINFWATWCAPCRLEIPDFNELHDKYNEKGLEILGISISDTKEQLLNFMKSYKIDYNILYGNNIEMQKVLFDYGGVYSIPVSFLIDTNGIIQRVYSSAILKDYDPNIYTDLIFNIENYLINKSENE